MDQVTALELRKNLAEISRQVREDQQKKVLVVHGEPNMGLVPVAWARVADQADQISTQHATIKMNHELAEIFRAQADILSSASEPMALSAVINTFVDHAMIVSKYQELKKKKTK